AALGRQVSGTSARRTSGSSVSTSRPSERPGLRESRALGMVKLPNQAIDALGLAGRAEALAGPLQPLPTQAFAQAWIVEQPCQRLRLLPLPGHGVRQVGVAVL